MRKEKLNFTQNDFYKDGTNKQEGTLSYDLNAYDYYKTGKWTYYNETGVASTAVGHALTTEENVLLVSGDVAFLYDINGLASVQELPDNIKVIVVNNGGGGIFRWLEGPNEVGLLASHFEAKPKTSIKAASRFCGLTYFCADDAESTKKTLSEFMHFTGPAVLEIVTDPKISSDVYKKYMKAFQNK